MPLGGSPVDISPLRAPFLDTFDTATAGSGSRSRTAPAPPTARRMASSRRRFAADSTQGGQYDQVECELGHHCAGWPATSTCRRTTNCWNGRARTASRPTLRRRSSSSNPGLFAIRESQAWGEQYSAWIPQVFTSQPTGDLAGTLRLQREGGTAVVLLPQRRTWVPIASGPISTDPALLNIGASSGSGRFVHQEVKIAWDNFRINSGTIVCPPGSWEDDTPDWQAAP